MRASEVPNELAERGIWWQVGGFTLTCIASALILQIYAGSGAVWFQYFELIATKLYWAAVLPLAGLFEGARKMFQNIRHQKEHAHKVGYDLGYDQALHDMGLPPRSPDPGPDAPAPAAPADPTSRRMAEAIQRFSVAEDGVVKISEETLAAIRFMANGADDAPAGS